VVQLKSRKPPTAITSVTIKDIAERLGIAHSTVSRALNDHPYTNAETKRRVNEAAAALGYVPNAGARTLRSAESTLIGLILPDVQNEIFAVATKVLADRCAKAGYQLALSVTEDDPSVELNHVQAFRQARALGIIITPSPQPLEKTLALLSSTVVVQFSRRHPQIDAPSVAAHGEHGISAAVTHLAQLGHRRIAYLGMPSDRSTGAERLLGYMRAMKQCGLAVNPALVRLGPTRIEFARATVTSLLHMKQAPTAMVLGTADLTQGAIEAIRAGEVAVPAAVSVVGFGDPSWFKLWGPGISTIGVPLVELAEAAVSLLLRQINSDGEESASLSQTRIALDPFLILRGTTAPPPAAHRRA
jgi:DNA-binding LacI/PurR family transcriptional regulator